MQLGIKAAAAEVKKNPNDLYHGIGVGFEDAEIRLSKDGNYILSALHENGENWRAEEYTNALKKGATGEL